VQVLRRLHRRRRLQLVAGQVAGATLGGLIPAGVEEARQGQQVVYVLLVIPGVEVGFKFLTLTPHPMRSQLKEYYQVIPLFVVKETNLLECN
jgi:hypothetical protein